MRYFSPEAAVTPAPPLLSVRALSIALTAGKGRQTPLVERLEFDLAKGETFVLVGESGSGKSISALALMRLLPPELRVTGGEILFSGQDILRLPESAMRARRGRNMAIIFQEPGMSLNAVLTVGSQLREALALCNITGRAARAEAESLLAQVGIGNPRRCLAEYPFQLSGGMKQRVMIAIALAGSPALLIADEPTTALDVTVQAQILDLLLDLQEKRGMSILLITHDLGVAARMARRIGVMYAGQMVELAEAKTFFRARAHPYSQALFAALPENVPREGTGARRLAALPGQIPAFPGAIPGCRFAERCAFALPRCATEAPAFLSADSGALSRCHFPASTSHPPGERQARIHPAASENSALSCKQTSDLLRVENLRVWFPVRSGVLRRIAYSVRAVDDVSFSIAPGRTLALVGESGCGKTTVGRALMRLLPTQGGAAFWQNRSLDARRQGENWRRNLQMVFQDPFASLNPRLTIRETLHEGIRALGVAPESALRGEAGQKLATALLSQVGLDAEAQNRYPHEFSGGQRQRIAIARALAVSPRLIICDEPTSALDVSVQAQILNLLCDVQETLGVAYLFITHNFAVVEHMAHEIAVMYLGRIVEQGKAEAVLQNPAHPYTQTLLASVPRLPVAESQEIAARSGNEASRPTKELAHDSSRRLPGEASSPAGCYFHPRCPDARPECRETYPTVTRLDDGRQVACHNAGRNE
ncbi:MAG: ABC transporter ATP-binding protein [Zoogloeaceae bacterium]|jgi:peptide/nickel transport system ATP-binding protein|nr:ABC transporter ATP-binding protein [Zoogloeaceae bacterium]